MIKGFGANNDKLMAPFHHHKDRNSDSAVETLEQKKLSKDDSYLINHGVKKDSISKQIEQNFDMTSPF
jgi:hypothetical protein